jgi:hypothetical protein
MQVGLISPIPELRNFKQDSSFHLVLSHLLNEHFDYASYYGDARLNGHFVVLDNSCHEFGFGNNHELLFEQARIHNFQEVVLPDELFSVSGTTKRTWDAIEWLKEHTEFVPDSLMIVPQGNDVDEFDICLETLLVTLKKAKLLAKITIGISKDFQVWEGGIYRIVEELIYPLLEKGDINDIHLLGWPTKLWELGQIATDFPKIRSTDSAKSFVYAMKNITLQYGVNIPYPHREKNYFESTFTDEQRKIARYNVQVFLNTAS